MKRKIFCITSISIIFLIGTGLIQNSYSLSCAAPTIGEEFSKSHWVFLGRFISENNAGPFSDNTILSFEVLENYKGKSSPIMKVLNNPSWHHSFLPEAAIIFAGPDLFGNPELFLCTNSGETSEQKILEVRILSEFFENDFLLPSPKTQIKNGIAPENILCNNELVLIFKAVDYSPACVKQSTSQKLLSRGWSILGNP